MSQIIHGVIHGRTIELAEDLGLADGQPVTVIVQSSPSPAGESGDRRSAAGMLADYPEMDADLERIVRLRRMPSRRELEQ